MSLKRTISGLLCCLLLGVQLVGIGNISNGISFFEDGRTNIIRPFGGPDPGTT